MTDKERLEHIKKELNTVVEELRPRLNELFFINDCLKDLVRVSDGKEPKRV